MLILEEMLFLCNIKGQTDQHNDNYFKEILRESSKATRRLSHYTGQEYYFPNCLLKSSISE